MASSSDYSFEVFKVISQENVPGWILKFKLSYWSFLCMLEPGLKQTATSILLAKMSSRIFKNQRKYHNEVLGPNRKCSSTKTKTCNLVKQKSLYRRNGSRVIQIKQKLLDQKRSPLLPPIKRCSFEANTYLSRWKC